jgi:hypothetical protein
MFLQLYLLDMAKIEQFNQIFASISRLSRPYVPFANRRSPILAPWSCLQLLLAYHEYSENLMPYRMTTVRTYLRSRWVRVGLGLLIIGSAPLLFVIMAAALHLWPDPNPNPIGGPRSFASS